MHTYTNSAIARVLALGSVIAAAFLSGCGGGGDSGSGGTPPPVISPAAKATLVGTYDPSGLSLPGGQGPGFAGLLTLPGDATVLTDYSPVAVHVTYHSPLPADEIVEYHVYRADFTGSGLTVVDADIPPGFPIYAQTGGGDLSFWDDGTDHNLNFTTLDLKHPGALTTVTSGAAVIPGTGIKEPLVGTRFAYVIEVLYKVGDKYHLSTKVGTNTVTYLQPAMLSADSFTGVSANRVFLNLPSILGADDYILELSAQASFTNKTTIKPYDPTLINSTGAVQTAPRQGPLFQYFNPSAGFNMTAAFPGAPVIFARVGARDSHNGAPIANNPYLYTNAVQVPAVLTH